MHIEITPTCNRATQNVTVNVICKDSCPKTKHAHFSMNSFHWTVLYIIQIPVWNGRKDFLQQTFAQLLVNSITALNTFQPEMQDVVV